MNKNASDKKQLNLEYIVAQLGYDHKHKQVGEQEKERIKEWQRNRIITLAHMINNEFNKKYLEWYKNIQVQKG